MTTMAENEQLARRVPEEIATEGNLDLVESVYAEDAVEHDPFGDANGRAEIRESIGGFIDAFEDFSATVEDIVADGDTVAMRVTLRGTHNREFLGIEPTGESFEVQNMVLTRVEDGRITERWVLPDALGMLMQLGVIQLNGKLSSTI